MFSMQFRTYENDDDCDFGTRKHLKIGVPNIILIYAFVNDNTWETSPVTEFFKNNILSPFLCYILALLLLLKHHPFISYSNRLSNTFIHKHFFLINLSCCYVWCCCCIFSYCMEKSFQFEVRKKYHYEHCRQSVWNGKLSCFFSCFFF